MLKKEEAVTGALVTIDRNGVHENGVITSPKVSGTGLVKILLLDGTTVIRHLDRISPRK